MSINIFGTWHKTNYSYPQAEWRNAMKLDFNLQITQKQGLTLTAQVQQAIKLLQMTNMEICEFVEEQFQDNPFVEETNFSEKDLKQKPETSDKVSVDKSLDENPYKKTQDESKLSQENQFETGDTYIPQSTVAKATSDFDAMSLVADHNLSLYAHCEAHIKTLNLNSNEQLIANYILEDLEPTGWISSDISLIAKNLCVSVSDIEHVLEKLQQIEPAGIFARNLKECLVLQARDRDVYCKNMASILENLHLMGAGKFDLLKRRSGCSNEQIAILFKLIKSFNPKPGLVFEQLGAPIREPDLTVRATNEGWSVELNNSTLPEVKIDKDFAKTLIRKVQNTSERDFIREKISEAKWLANAISKRNETMLKVGSEIIKRQTVFLEKGAQYIEPMILNDIADAVGMHESTISRVTTGSLIQTPRGTLELKAFFSVGVKQDGNNGSASSTSIKFKIKKLIDQEDPKSPISDDLIVEILAKDGLKVARRTVAKYRKIENIPSSFARKRRNVLSGVMG